METIDRPIKDIIDSIMEAVVKGKIKGQLARDLEKLCGVAMTSSYYGNDLTEELKNSLHLAHQENLRLKETTKRRANALREENESLRESLRDAHSRLG